MTACTRFAPMIGARPGELPDEEARALAEHLATCDACQARLADEEALSGMLSEALTAEANQRDFSTFADEVLERIEERRGILSRLGAWARRHRAAAILSGFAPAAAAALVVYLTIGHGGGPEQSAALEVSTGDRGAMVLETSEGPIVLLGGSDSES